MNSLSRILIFFAFLALFQTVSAQRNVQDSCIAVTFLGLEYSPMFPSGDLDDRFGFTSLIGGSVGYKFDNNFYVNGGFKAIFGGVVKERIAENIVTLERKSNGGYVGSIIGANGQFSDVRFFQAGYVIPVYVGKIFSVFPNHNPNSGIYVEVGAQFIQHKVRIEIPSANVPALDPEFRSGYDRLTNGIGAIQGFGYRFTSDNRLVNFFVGAEVSQNFTRSRRDINVDTGVAETNDRLDLLFGMKVGWVFMIYKNYTEEYYQF